MKYAGSQHSSERGAMLIQVAVFLLVLIGITALVLDHGVMWASRAQAQTSADAGALAGAITLAFEEGSTQATAQAKAQVTAKQNGVWGESPEVLLTDITFPPCPPGAPGLPDTCVKVDAFRNQARSNALPVFFAHLLGIDNQGVRSTATAQVLTGSSTDCLKPWAVIDRWSEFGPEGFQPSSTFDKYSDGKGGAPPAEGDVYIAPGTDDAYPNGTGFTLPSDQGRQFAIKTDSGGSALSSGWFREIQLPRADGHWTGGSVYNENIRTCGGLDYAIAKPGIACPADIGQEDAEEWASKGCYRVKTGGTTGPTRDGVEFLVDQDVDAHYVDGVGEGTGIVGSKFDPPTKSPRVVPIGVMDIDDYLSRNPTGSNGVVRLVNIYGFFVEGMGDFDEATGAMELKSSGKAVIGRIIKIPSTGRNSSPIPISASFLRSIILVR